MTKSSHSLRGENLGIGAAPVSNEGVSTRKSVSMISVLNQEPQGKIQDQERKAWSQFQGGKQRQIRD